MRRSPRSLSLCSLANSDPSIFFHPSLFFRIFFPRSHGRAAKETKMCQSYKEERKQSTRTKVKIGCQFSSRPGKKGLKNPTDRLCVKDGFWQQWHGVPILCLLLIRCEWPLGVRPETESTRRQETGCSGTWTREGQSRRGDRKGVPFGAGFRGTSALEAVLSAPLGDGRRDLHLEFKISRYTGSAAGKRDSLPIYLFICTYVHEYT